MTDQADRERAGKLDRSPKGHSGTLQARVVANLITRGLADIEQVEGEELFQRGRESLRDDGWADAVRWFRLAADQGHAGAQARLGLMYAKGRSVPRDYVEAVRWFRLGVDQGHADAQAGLGFMCANGRGVPQDDGEAARWYGLAADEGDAGVQSTSVSGTSRAATFRRTQGERPACIASPRIRTTPESS